MEKGKSSGYSDEKIRGRHMWDLNAYLESLPWRVNLFISIELVIFLQVGTVGGPPMQASGFEFYLPDRFFLKKW